MTIIKSIFHIPNRKNNKVPYYFENSVRYLIPGIFPRMTRDLILKKYDSLDLTIKNEIADRVNYYNKLEGAVQYSESASDGSEMISLDKLRLKATISGKKAKKSASEPGK